MNKKEIAMKQYFLKVMPDYCSSGLWDQNNHGIMTTLSDLIPSTAEVKALEKDIQGWNDKYDKDVKHDGPSPDFDWENFHKEGIMLAKRVKKIMGPNGKVLYFKEAEYSSLEKSEEILIQD